VETVTDDPEVARLWTTETEDEIAFLERLQRILGRRHARVVTLHVDVWADRVD
jgi:hypothetical protein